MLLTATAFTLLFSPKDIVIVPIVIAVLTGVTKFRLSHNMILSESVVAWFWTVFVVHS